MNDTQSQERVETFPCFGSRCAVIVSQEMEVDAATAAANARARLLEWHDRFSRFLADSELSRLNRDPRRRVPVTPLMRRVLTAAITAAADTGGLVDPTLCDDIEAAGYVHHFDGDGVPLREALAQAPKRRPARPRAESTWQQVTVDRRTGVVDRPLGVRLDPGGIAKGVFADELATQLGRFAAVVIDCGGDLRLAGTGGVTRAISVPSPFGEGVVHTYELASGGVATSGIGARSWWSSDGRPAHHLLDPSTGQSAFTGVVQATALAPSATEAEALSKAAVLSGADHAAGWLVHGGVLVFDDGSYEVVAPRDKVAGAARRGRASTSVT